MPTINGLTAATTVASSDLLPVWQGNTTKKLAVASIFTAQQASTSDTSGTYTYVSPLGVTLTAVSGAAMNGNYWGIGQVTTADTNKRGKWFSTLKAAPASLGVHTGIDTSFNGDLSAVPFAIEHRITGTNTLGAPASGFTWVPEACPMYMVVRNASGHNESTSSNDGRTAMSGIRIKAYHAGQGGTNLISGSIVFSNAGSVSNTNFLANPAGCFLVGDYFATVDGVYADAMEVSTHDQGHDIAAIGHVINHDRTNNTGALFAWWTGIRVQSQGSAPINSVFSASGKADIGLDLSMLDHSASSATYTNAAVTLKADQRIYMNVNTADTSGLNRFPSALRTDYIVYSSGITGFNVVVNNASSLQMYTDHVNVMGFANLGLTAGDYWRFSGSAGGLPTMQATGTSTDISPTFKSKGTGTFIFANASAETQFVIGNQSGATNHLEMRGGASGPAIIQAVSATDTDVDIQFTPKGAGLLRHGTYTTKAAEAFAGYITIKDAAGNTRKIMVCA